MDLEIRWNGEPRGVRQGTTVAGLLEQLRAELALRPEAVAVERNGRIVRRAEREATRIEAGDRLEIVTLVGGG